MAATLPDYTLRWADMQQIHPAIWEIISLAACRLDLAKNRECGIILLARGVAQPG